MYRFVLRPRWILSHLLVLGLVAACFAAGFWQLSRLSDKQESISRYEERATLPLAPMTELLTPASTAADVDAVALRPVSVSGRYLPDEEVTVRNRTLEGAPGYWVLTPMATDSGEVVVVNRGWVPLVVGETPERLAEAKAPSGEVVAVGTITATQTRGSFGGVDPSEGHLDDLARADIGRIADQVEAPVLPAYVTLVDQEPAQGLIPVPVEPVPPDEGPHLGYAFQWFIFGAIAAGGYPLILRKVARERAEEKTGGPRRPRRSALVPVDD